MSSSLITSKDNKIYKLINSLKKPKYRKKNSMFILEGKRLVYEAIERSASIVYLSLIHIWEDPMKYKKFFIIMFILILCSSISALLAPIFIQLWKANGTSLDTKKIVFIVLLILASKVLTILFTIFREKFAKEYNKGNFISYIKNIFNMNYDSIIEKGAMNLLERASISVNSCLLYTSRCV